MESHNQSGPNAFFEGSRGSFRRVPKEQRDSNNTFSRAAFLGVTAASADYLLGPELFGTDRSGPADEISASLALVAGTLIGSIHSLKSLCAADPEKKAEEKLNVGKGAVGGALAGAGLIKLIPAAAATVLLDGGLVLGGVLIAAGGAWAYNALKKKKYCPHCKQKGHCSQSVCRNCGKLFYPSEQKVDCKETPFLTWELVAAYLHRRQLAYLDAELLIRENIGEWEIYTDSSNNVFLDCMSFLAWTECKKKEIISYRGRGSSEKTKSDVSRELDRRGL